MNYIEEFPYTMKEKEKDGKYILMGIAIII